MDKIIFYIGDETGHVVEKKNFRDSFFCEQYTSALKLLKSIYNAKGPISNIIAFCGDRGEGKTSCMRSFMQLLRCDSELHFFESDLPFSSSDLEILDVIDPAFFDKKHNLIELVLGQMYGRLADKMLSDEEYSENFSQKHELLKYFQKAKMHLSHLEKEKRELYDPLEELGALSAGINLKKCLGTLVDKYLEFQGKKKLIIAIDDLDLNMTEGYRMAEQIRKYLNQKSCILLIGLNVGQLTAVIKNSIAQEIGVSLWEYEDLSAMASKYVMKLIPYGNRVLMPSINELCDVKLQICHHDDPIKESKDLNSVKDEVTRLIFKKTRYLFYNEKGSVSPIVPQNLRSLRLLLGMLMQMEDFKDNKSHSANKRIFRAYFFEEWTKCLDSDDQMFVKGLLNYHDLSGINMYVIKHVESKPFRNQQDENDTSEYDVSLGMVLRKLTDIDNSNTDSEIKNLIFFLRSFYSMKLYELYDVITESKDGIYPLVSSEDSEVVKVDTVFKNVNQLQKLLNGGYFRYSQNELLAPRKGENPRDLHAISGSKLNEMLKSVSENLEKFKDVSFSDNDDTDEAKEWRKFTQEFRMCEFFVLTTLRSLPSKEKNNANSFFVSLNPSLPAYMTDYNQNMGYYLFDVMAPFYNIVNVKYAYLRFAEIANLYDYALSHEWSLLRSMMSAILQDRDKSIAQETEMEAAMHCLVSDAIIRNTDVHSSIIETMQTNRQKIKETGSTTVLLEKTYAALTKIGMKTYFYSEGKAHEIRFAFLNAIIDFLKDMDDTIFDDIFYVNNEDLDKQSELSSEDSALLDNLFPALQKSRFPLKGATVLKRMYSDIKPDYKIRFQKEILPNYIAKDKSYDSWKNVKNIVAPIVDQLKTAVLGVLSTEVDSTE